MDDLEQLERYLRTGDGRDLPSLPPAELPPRPGADAAETALLALLRWYRYLHLPGVGGLLEYRAAIALAVLLDREPKGLPPLPAALRAHMARHRPAGRGRWRRRDRAAAAPEEQEEAESVALGPARIDQLLFLMERFEGAHDYQALDTARELQLRWQGEEKASARERAALLTDHAHLLLTVGELGAHRSWQEEGERAARLAVEITARHRVLHDPHLANRLLLKARIAVALHDADADPSGLERAVRDLRRAVEAAGHGTPVHLHHARHLVTTLTRRHETDGSPETLTEALVAARELVRATHPDDRRGPEHRQWLEDLRGRAVPRLGARTVDAVVTATAARYAPDSERAQAWWATADDPGAPPGERREAALKLVEAVPGDDEDRAAALLLAAQTELDLWLAAEHEASPRQAHVWAVRAVDAAPVGHPLAARSLTLLAESSLHLGSESFEAIDEEMVEQALAHVRRARSEIRPDAPDAPLLLERLATVLVGVSLVLSDGTLLNEAADVRRQALELTPETDPFRPFRLSNMANELSRLARSAGKAELLEEALVLAREAADALPEDHPRKHELLFNLAEHHVTARGGGQGAVVRLAEAERLYRLGLPRLPADHPDLPRFTSAISQVLYMRHQETGDRAPLADAVPLARDAAARTPVGDRYHTPRLTLLARAVTGLYELSAADGHPDAELRAEALATWDAVARDAYLSTPKRFEAEERRATLALASGDPEHALRALEAALAEVPRFARRSLAGPVRKDMARRAPELAAQAALAAAEAGYPTRGVELLEQGRAILYAQAITAWRHRAELRVIDAQAADRLEEIDRRLAEADLFANASKIDFRFVTQRAFGRTTTDAARSWDPRPGQAAATRRLAAERERIVERFAGHPRISELTGPASLAALRARIAGSPVAFVLTHGSRGAALLVPADPARPVDHIALPGLTETAARTRIALLETALNDAMDPATKTGRRAAAQSELHDVLEWLWDEVAAPVLSRLDTPGPGRPKPRLWWCPVGPLVRLPLHAAGHHPRSAAEVSALAAGAAGGGLEPADAPPTVIDRVIPSYTPTLAALAHSLRDGSPDQDASGRRAAGGRPDSLVVAVPDSPHGPPLPLAEREARTVLRALSGARLLMGDEADLATVLQALREHTLVHFACHGDNDTSLGLLRGGGLHLGAGETLTATELQETPLEHGALAVLSACSTAEAHAGLPDEPVHLAAAFQLAGFRSVVGTLWRAPDTPGMAHAFYAALTASGAGVPDTARSAQALNQAQLAVRDAYPATPTRWAAYLHSGA